ncbi:MAG: enolase C-terminal domain-like protein, partial [Bulleidia sp.]
VKEHSRIRIAADESVHLPVDALRIAEERAADVVNIKLMKCGGIFRALQINAICEAAGIACMIGCMGESPLANAAGLHLAAALDNITEIDLDSAVILKHDHMHAGYTQEGGKITLSEEPGIGFRMEGEE